MLRIRSLVRWSFLGLALAVMGPAAAARAELVMKVLIVNPSDSEVKEFDIRNPLPPEVKPEHVLDAEGLKVEYDSQAGTYVLVGSVTLKPKESVIKRIVLEDVWVVPADRLTGVRQEAAAVVKKLTGTSYAENAQVMAKSIERRLAEIEESQDQPFVHPVQHINRYRENVKVLQTVEADLVSLRQLMVMAALNPPSQAQQVIPNMGEPQAGGAHDKGELSVLATWRLIFIILGLLGFVSLSFFLIWQGQLKTQLAKQAARDNLSTLGTANGETRRATDGNSSSSTVASSSTLPRSPMPGQGPMPPARP